MHRTLSLQELKWIGHHILSFLTFSVGTFSTTAWTRLYGDYLMQFQTQDISNHAPILYRSRLDLFKERPDLNVFIYADFLLLLRPLLQNLANVN